MDDLRRLTVKVLLALLVFAVVGNFFDDLLFGDKVHTPVEVFALVGGMITGLFTPEMLWGERKRKPPDDEE